MIDPQRIQAVFLEIVELPNEEREAALERICGDDTELRERLEALLRAHDENDSFLADSNALAETNASDPVSGTTHPAAVAPFESGAVIASRYTLRDKIGEGGMGEVWSARQSEPIKRKVALKLIKLGMDSRNVVTRFEQERQALAMMDHPNIARVLDGGLTPTGQPFFVMELVNGLTLTQYCDETRLSVQERLELFVPICQAIQHAHQKGIVHRDLKPANILVTNIDGKPVPKVIDFGVAKATGAKITEETLTTRFGAVVGTLEYMSPEQAGYAGEDIDTRADIYSLGVVLYELLTGLRPHDSKRLKDAGLAEMIRMIKEEDPARPSTRLSNDESLPSIAASRSAEPRKLAAALKGELDWVVMKCLEKERSRRYETANGLSRDIQRYLANETVEARPQSARYRLRKFVQRNRGQVVAAVMILGALIAGMIGTTYGLFRANEQRIAAEEAQADAEDRRIEADNQRERAKEGERQADEEKQIAQAVKDFLQKKLLSQASIEDQADALIESGKLALDAKRNPTIKELLDRAADELSVEKIEDNFADQPAVQAEILATLASSYYSIGDEHAAIEHAERAYEIRKKHLGEANKDTLDVGSFLGRAYLLSGKLEKGVRLYERILKIAQREFGEVDDFTIIAMNNLACVHQAQGDPVAAVQLLEKALKLCKIGNTVEPVEELMLMDNLAKSLQDLNQTGKALAILQDVHQRSVQMKGIGHPHTQRAAGNLAVAYSRMGQESKAIPLLEKRMKIAEEQLPEHHSERIIATLNLSRSYSRGGEPDRALKLVERNLNLVTEKFDHEHPLRLHTISSAAILFQSLGRIDQAIAITESALAKAKGKLPGNHSSLFRLRLHLGNALIRSREPIKAVNVFEDLHRDVKQLSAGHRARLDVLDRLTFAYQKMGQAAKAIAVSKEEIEALKGLGLGHPASISARSSLGKSLREHGQFTEAVAIHKEAYEGAKAYFGSDSTKTVQHGSDLGTALIYAGQIDQAIALVEDVLRQTTEVNHETVEVLDARDTLARAYYDRSDYAKAIEILEENLEGYKKAVGLDHGSTSEAMQRLATALSESGQFERAQSLLQTALKRATQQLGPGHPESAEIMYKLAIAKRKLGQSEQAIKLLEQAVAIQRKALGETNEKTLWSLNSLGQCYWMMKQLDKSVALFEEVIAGYDATKGRNSLPAMTTIANLGVSYMDRRQLDKALPLLEQAHQYAQKDQKLLWVASPLARAYGRTGQTDRALQLCQRLLESKSTSMYEQALDSLLWLCNELARQKKYSRALTIAKEALESGKSKLGPNHGRTLAIMHFLGTCFRAMNQVEEARDVQAELLERRISTLGEDHKDTIKAMQFLAVTYWIMKQLDKSVPLFEKVYAFHLKHDKLDTMEGLYAAANLGVNYRDAGQLEEALPLLERVYEASKSNSRLSWATDEALMLYVRLGKTEKAVELAQAFSKQLREKSMANRVVYGNLLAVEVTELIAAKGYEAALILAKDCLKVREEVQPEAWNTFNAQAMVGIAHLRLGDLKQAEPLLLAGYRGMKQREASVPPQGMVNLTRTLQALVDLYEKTNDEENTAKWKKELAEFEAKSK